ncbi:hypothetical protein KC19_6G201600 [Ceratodon purpureus]|uniref:Secreted protein n=1 Tax=Ceratodon purpureus TaxID=3225 RepID=A0A8T0HJK8_CERPU|nr:hypothetical protein KC19_6G201600 [Ceratodon purpureus]
MLVGGALCCRIVMIALLKFSNCTTMVRKVYKCNVIHDLPRCNACERNMVIEALFYPVDISAFLVESFNFC